MSPVATLLWLASLSLDTFAQLSLKAAATAEGDGLRRWLAMMSDRWLWLAIFSYSVGFFVWIAFLSLVPLSQGVLMSSVTILTVQVGGRLFFKERMTPKRVFAALMIAAGVAMVGWA